MIIQLLTKRIYQRFTHKIVAKTNWHRYGTKLRHCHPMYYSLRDPHIARGNYRSG